MAISSSLAPLHDLSDDLLERYNTRGPRYTSYPTAPLWHEGFGPQEFLTAIYQTKPFSKPLSLYVHIPFCLERCLYCSCNVIITRQTEQAETYLKFLFQEMEEVARLVEQERPVMQLHWGGGTPTYLTPEQLERLFQRQKSLFALHPDAEIAIEIDPRVTSLEQLQTLRALGFNRVSLGVQDFNPTVQETVHRIQSRDHTAQMVEDSRTLGFTGINFDLIYGLPHQTVASFQETVAAVIQMAPDRIALYNYAHVPWISPHQGALPESTLPTATVKVAIFKMALNAFLKAGYVYIGMDHFAKPGDELAEALDTGQLHRNFMGYTVQRGPSETPDTDLYGFGVSAISDLGAYYAQNVKKLPAYYERVTQKTLPTQRGYALTSSDVLHKQVILAILCQGAVDFPTFEARFGIDFRTHFKASLAQLSQATADGLLTQSDRGLQLTSLGRLFSRNIAMAFDAHLETPLQSGQSSVFSRTV